MRFTKYNSMNDILAFPEMEEYLKIFYSEYLLEMYPKDLYAQPLALEEQFGETPWGEPFSIIVDQLMDASNLILDICVNKTRRCISLWNPGEDWSLEKEAGGKGEKDAVFLLAPQKQVVEAQKAAPAVIICPGGGYEAVCFSGEGTPVMHFMEAQGYRAFILKYRVAPAEYPAPQEDLALAIQYVRSHAVEYGVDPENITVLGASAGGHLCASEAALYEEAAGTADLELQKTHPEAAKCLMRYSARPDQVCLCYPVISFVNEPHEGSAQALTGRRRELREELSAEKLVTAAYPPTFVWTCADDDCVPPSNAVHMGEALKASGVRHELCVYPSGGHGCGLAYTKSAYEWSRRMIEFLSSVIE